MKIDSRKLNSAKLLGSIALSCTLGPQVAHFGEYILNAFDGVPSNLIAHFLLKTDTSKIEQLFQGSASEQPNHDLLKAFTAATENAIDAIQVDYHKRNKDKPEQHFDAISRKMKLLKNTARRNMFNHLAENYDGKEIELQLRQFAENKENNLEEIISSFIGTDELGDHGYNFKSYFEKHFISQLQFQFDEQLKEKPKAWVAYQRLWINDFESFLKSIKKSQIKPEDINAFKTELTKIEKTNVQLTELQNRILGEQEMNRRKLKEIINYEFKLLKELQQNYFTEINDSIKSLESEVVPKIDRILTHIEDSIALPHLTFDFIESKTMSILKKEFQDKNSHFYKKYIDKIYQARHKAENEFNRFLYQNEKKCYIITGKAGKGKTTLFCKLALYLTQSDKKGVFLPMLFNSPELRFSEMTLKGHIEEIFEGHSFSEVLNIAIENQTSLVVFIDAINELEGKNVFETFNRQMSSLINEINSNNLPIKFCISCRSEFWRFFNQEDWVTNETFCPEQGLSQHPTVELSDFPEKEIDKIIQVYFDWFRIKGNMLDRAKQQCRDPLMLRYFCEAYTNRKSNDKKTLPENIPEETIDEFPVLHMKAVFDVFVENIRERMFKRVEVSRGTSMPEHSLEEYTTMYLLNLAQVMLDSKKERITLKEAIQVAKKLNHPDSELSSDEFAVSEKSIFFMFVDEGLILDKHRKGEYIFVFESYFEYTLGRCIARKRWKDILYDSSHVSSLVEGVIDDLEKLLLDHDKCIKKDNFTNLLGAIHYAILVTKDDKLYADHPGLFIQLLERMMTHDHATLAHQQRALSTYRESIFSFGLRKIEDKHKADSVVQAILKSLCKYIKKTDDFVISKDFEITLIELAEFHQDMVVTEMLDWSKEEGKTVMQILAAQVIGRLAQKNHSVIMHINSLALRKDFRKSFWLARTLIFTINEIAQSKENTLSGLDARQLGDTLIELINSNITPIYTKDLAFSVLPFLVTKNHRYIDTILSFLNQKKVSAWGAWNAIYELRDWKNFGEIDESSWIWKIFEQVLQFKDPHIGYAVNYALMKFNPEKLPKNGKSMLEELETNIWIRDRLDEDSGEPVSDEKGTKTGIVYSPIYLEPSYDNHTECRQRLQAIISKLEEVGYNHYNWIHPITVSEKQLQMVHSGEYDRHRNGSKWPNYLKEVMQAGKLFDNQEINIRHHGGPNELRYESLEVARMSAGGVIAALKYVLKTEKEAPAAWSLGRPPGHLANNSICIFNNIAIGARYAKARYKIKRILIIDCDAHHGQHTARVFYKDPNVIYFSVHIEGGYAKEEGHPKETGGEAGKGYTFNITYPQYTDDRGYKYITSSLLEPLALEFRPELIMVSAGFDGHVEDELNPGGMFTEKSFINLAETIKTIASKLNIKVVGALEGGYGLDSTANSFVHMMNIIGDWGVQPEDIGFVENEGIEKDDEKLEKVKKTVRERVMMMKKTKSENPDYNLYENEDNWKTIIN